MKLYYSPGACSLAVHVALEWIGEPYQTQAVKPGSPEFVAINPAGAVPALDTGEGWLLTQAGAILRHLGIHAVRLLSNNPDKVRAIEEAGVVVAERVPCIARDHESRRSYLETKREKMGHLLG